MLIQRSGSWTELDFYEEQTADSDSGITTGYPLPLSGESGLRAAQNLLSVPVFKGDQRPFGKVMGPKTFAGKVPLNLEFTTLGRLLVVFFGRAGYSRPHAGTSSLHRFLISNTPGPRGTAQFQSQSKETTAVTLRGRAAAIQNVNFRLGTSGPALYDIDVMGIGDIVTGTTSFGSLVDDGLVPTTYFNGSLNIKGASATDVNAANISLMGNVSRSEVVNNGGKAGSLSYGNIEPKGSVQFLFTATGSNEGADLNAWNDAIQQIEVGIDCIWTDQPVDGPAFPTKYFRIYTPTARMGAASFVPGGMNGKTINQPFEASRSRFPNSAASSFAAENHNFPTGGPYALDATHFNLGVKVDGGATITTNLGTVSQTATQIVNTLMANASFTAVAKADVFLGNYVRITSKQASSFGANSSVQIDTAVANSAHVQLGFDNVAMAGVSNCELIVELSNALGASY